MEMNIEIDFTLPRSHTLDYGTTDKVHHTNYFRQRRTVNHLMKWLDLSE